jgi:hypothetical protein
MFDLLSPGVLELHHQHNCLLCRKSIGSSRVHSNMKTFSPCYSLDNTVLQLHSFKLLLLGVTSLAHFFEVSISVNILMCAL